MPRKWKNKAMTISGAGHDGLEQLPFLDRLHWYLTVRHPIHRWDRFVERRTSIKIMKDFVLKECSAESFMQECERRGWNIREFKVKEIGTMMPGTWYRIEDPGPTLGDYDSTIRLSEWEWNGHRVRREHD